MRLIILGNGKYGKEIEDIAEQIGKYSEIVFLDDNAVGEKILGKCDEYYKYNNTDTAFFVAFGNNDLREKWSENLKQSGIILENIIHPTAYVSPKAVLNHGIAVLPKVAVNTNTIIKDGCMINTGSIVDHDCIVEAYTHVCVGAIVKADNHIPAKMKIEAGIVIERETYI